MADWDPTAYGRVNTLQRYLAREALSRLQVRGDERVLDVGCGDGRVTELVVDQLTSGSMIGVDPSEAMVRAARQRFAGRPRTEFAVATAASLPYRNEFDLVTSFNALHWELEWKQALAHTRAALRTQGRAFLVFVCGGSRPSVEDVLMRITRDPRWRRWFDGFAPPFIHVDPDAYARAAVDAGFRADRHDVVDLQWDFGDRAAFSAWLAAGAQAWTNQLPDPERGRFVDEAIAAYAAVSGSDSLLRFLQCRMALAVP